MPRSYVPTLLALKTPEILFALSLAGTVVAFTTVVRRDVAAPRRAVLLLLLVSAALPIVIAVMTRPAMYNGLRHFVFVTPPLAVLGGFGGARLFEALRKYGRAWLIGATAIFAAGLALPTAEFVRLHPYQYTYFNHLAGGIRGARGAYMLDYWGLSLKQASEGLRARAGEPPAGRPWRVAVCGPHPPAEVVLGSQFETTWDPVGADFAMMLGEFYCRQPSAPVVVEVAREGVIYARVFDIRKHPIDTLFTIPPVQ
jgi:hypothetical protein